MTLSMALSVVNPEPVQVVLITKLPAVLGVFWKKNLLVRGSTVMLITRVASSVILILQVLPLMRSPFVALMYVALKVTSDPTLLGPCVMVKFAFGEDTNEVKWSATKLRFPRPSEPLVHVMLTHPPALMQSRPLEAMSTACWAKLTFPEMTGTSRPLVQLTL